MITCKKCQESNPPDQTVCKKCAADLLPGETIGGRIGSLAAGIIGGIIAGFIAYFLITHPDITESSKICLLTNPTAWFFGAFAAPITGIVSAVRKTPLYIRYEKRAIRHKEIDPEQALADYSKALEIAPEKYRASLLKARADIYSKLGKEEQAVEDRLAYTYSEGAYEGESSFARMLGADRDTFVSASIKDERKRMLASGKIKAVGYCGTCDRVLELTETQKCPHHPKAKPQDITYIMPKDLETAIAKVEHERVEQHKKTGNKRMVIFVILGIIIVICIVIPVLLALFSK